MIMIQGWYTLSSKVFFYEEWMTTEIITDDEGKEKPVSEYSYYVKGEEM